MAEQSIFEDFAKRMEEIYVAPSEFEDEDPDLWTFGEAIEMFSNKIIEDPDNFRRMLDQRVALCRNPRCGSVVTDIHDAAMEEVLSRVYPPDNKCVYCRAFGSWTVIPGRILRELYEEVSGDPKKWRDEVDL